MTFFDSLKKWFYTKNSSAASSDARVPLLDASGNPKGSDTMANLASVLGVWNQTISAGDISDADELVIGMKGWYITNAEESNYPTTGNVLIFSWNYNGNPSDTTIARAQICIGDTGAWFRFKETYSTIFAPWSKISTDIPSFYKNYQDIVSLTSGVKQTMKVSQKTLIVPANGSNSELGLQANPFIIIKADTSNFNGCIVLLCDDVGFMVLGNYGGFNDWVTLSASGANLVIQNKTGVQLTLPVFTFVG